MVKAASFEVSDLELAIGQNQTATPEAWAVFGNRLKLAQRELEDLLLDPLVRKMGRNRGRKLLRILNAIDAAKDCLDGQVCSEFLGWHDAKKVFYGPVEIIRRSSQ
jgi:hypothetical protein